MRGLLVGLVVAAGCTSSGAVFHGRDAGPPDTGPIETGPAAGSGGGGGGGSSGLGGIGAVGGGGMGGGGTGGGPWDPTVGAISAGNDYIVATFPTAAGVIVVRGGHIEIVSRAGASLALLTTPRENLAASFDGTELVVSDRAMLTAYDTSLAFLGQTPVNEPCNTIDAVGGRIVCQGWYSVYQYYSYTPRTGAAPIPSLAFPTSTNAGAGPVIRVPGRQQFLTLDGGSLNALVLHDVSAAGVVSNAAGLIGSAWASLGARWVAFDSASAPRRLLADDGKYYRLGPADCLATDPQTCLTADGALEPRTTPVEIIVAAVGDGAGHFLVLRTPRYAAQKDWCQLGCAFDSIDATTGKVDRTTMVRFSVTKPVSAQYDPVIDGMVLGYQSPDGDRVSLLDFSNHTATVGPEPYAANGLAPVLPPLDSPLSGCAPSKRLVDGQDRVVTVAPVSGGLLLVTEAGLFRMDRAGNILTTVSRAQPPLSGVFDAGMLVIGDAQGLAIYDQSLRLVRQISVTNGCQTVAVLSASHIVCESRDPIYTSAATVLTYAADSGALLASKAQDALGQLPLRLRRVPGVEALVARGDVDSVYRLFGTASDGAVSFVNTTLSQNWTPGMPFALWGSGRSGSKPAHLIAWSGTLLKIYNPDCVSTGPPFESGCFVPVAEVGTQRADQRFVAMEIDGDDLYGISSGSNLYAPATTCPDECYVIQHIDLPGRRVVSSRLQSIHLGEKALEIAHDAECGMILVTSIDGFDTVGGSDSQYYVDLLDYGGP